MPCWWCPGGVSGPSPVPATLRPYPSSRSGCPGGAGFPDRSPWIPPTPQCSNRRQGQGRAVRRTLRSRPPAPGSCYVGNGRETRWLFRPTLTRPGNNQQEKAMTNEVQIPDEGAMIGRLLAEEPKLEVREQLYPVRRVVLALLFPNHGAEITVPFL